MAQIADKVNELRAALGPAADPGDGTPGLVTAAYDPSDAKPWRLSDNTCTRRFARFDAALREAEYIGWMAGRETVHMKISVGDQAADAGSDSNTAPGTEVTVGIGDQPTPAGEIHDAT